ncbi:MAG: NAD(P)/FAD-dependent oxidoreductase [Verrucomicrobiae bacterium]|nr:NAD(P)/FAD-dependent oxidoreductase [Verrucomicrobiae bacterium]
MNVTEVEIVVVGAGPGGYAAAFYAADYGKKVLLVEQDSRLGGVCLNCGCIPSKALLHAVHAIQFARESARRGIVFREPNIDLNMLRGWKESVLERLRQGIVQLAQRRKVGILHGRGHFEDSNTLRVETSEGQKFIKFKHAIIATGSKPAIPKAFDLGNPRVMTSTEALDVEEIPARLLVVGGGYIGMELGSLYAMLGSEVVVVELLDHILAGADPDLARPIVARARQTFKEIRLKARVLEMSTKGRQIRVIIEHEGNRIEELYDRVLVAVGRVPNTDDLGLEFTRVTQDEKGFIIVDENQRTEDP